MIHRITLSHVLLRDYERRQVFPRYWNASQHPMMDDISIKVSSEELKVLLDDAEQAKDLKFTNSPNLTRAYVRFAQWAREMLRRDPEQPEIGRDGKSAAAGD